MTNSTDFMTPDWPAATRVRALVTTRAGGVSGENYESWNLASHVGDDPDAVALNRNRLMTRAGVPSMPRWLNQTHSNVVVLADDVTEPVEADASWSHSPQVVCAVLTADCLPVLFATEQGDVVAAAHAGWRGLADGILENTVRAMGCDPATIMAWLGPAIGPQSFEVGSEVYDAFCVGSPACEAAFLPAQGGKHLADIYQLATIRLNQVGVTGIYGDGLDTVSDPRFYSYRQQPVTGRMASLIWIA